MNNVRFLLAVVCVVVLLAGFPNTCKSQFQPVDKPNIILINLDDADIDMLSPENLALFYPNLQRFSAQGLQLTNFHVTTPLCGPSRAALFRGQYAHNSGIRTNDPLVSRSNGFEGGMYAYGQRGHYQNDLGMWMKNAGYHTMMIGKYLHGDTVDLVPEGWDDFYSSRGANYYATARYTNENGTGIGYIEPVTTYRTRKESEEAVMLIDRHAAREDGKPFFLYLAPLAPHQQTPHDANGMVEERYKDWWPGLLMPMTPDVMEVDFTDKSTAIRSSPQFTEKQAGDLNPRHRDRMLTIKSVDDMFGEILTRLAAHQQLDNTYFILTSDNGFSNGHHRNIGKGDPFNRSSNVPTYVLGPGVPAGQTANHLLAHIDLAPTIVDLADGAISPEIDGMSFKQLMFNPLSVDERSWREAILIQNWEMRTVSGVEMNVASVAARFFNTIYVEWANGSPEYYHLGNDPHQLNNIYDQLATQEQNFLTAYLKTMRQELIRPITTISHPFHMNQLHGRNRPFRGMAEDDSGVDRVLLVIKRFSDSWYWNGQDWQPGRVRVQADVTNQGQQLTSWSYDSIPTGQSTDELIGIWARAYDDAGNFDKDIPWVVFRLDYTRPESGIETPQINENVPEFKVTGTTYDEAGVDHVRLVIRSIPTGKYWDGAEWVDNWTYFTEPVRRNGRWTWEHPEFEGWFFVSSRAVDTSGNVESPPSQTWFVVNRPE